MWSRLLNVFVLQIFFLQSFASASTPTRLGPADLKSPVKILKDLGHEELQQVFLSIRPLLHKDDATMIDFNFFEGVIRNITVTEKGLKFNVENEEIAVSDIDLKTFSAKYNGKRLDLRKSVAENFSLLYPQSSSRNWNPFLDTAHAQSEVGKAPPGRLKVIGLLIAGVIVAVITAGSIAWGWISIGKGNDQTVHEIKAPGVEEVFKQDCKVAKQELKKASLGEKTSDLIRKIKMNMQMLAQTRIEALKMKQDQQVRWIEEVKDCYQEALDTAEKVNTAVKDESTRSVKEVKKSQPPKAPAKKASGQ